MLTYKQAIKSECRYCMNTRGLEKGFVCNNKSCKLRDLSLTPLKRIRKHCLDCVGTPSEVRKCTGMVLKPTKHLCPFHPYRDGHNPKMKGRKLSEKQRRNAIALGEKARLRAKLKRSSVKEG